jgi:hypothetical protein
LSTHSYKKISVLNDFVQTYAEESNSCLNRHRCVGEKLRESRRQKVPTVAFVTVQHSFTLHPGCRSKWNKIISIRFNISCSSFLRFNSHLFRPLKGE